MSFSSSTHRLVRRGPAWGWAGMSTLLLTEFAVKFEPVADPPGRLVKIGGVLGSPTRVSDSVVWGGAGEFTLTGS